MPVREHTEPGPLPGTNRYYYSWGRTGAKYYFNPVSEVSRMIARDKATKQGDAIKQSMARRKIMG